MFEKGSYVVYGNSGICMIDDITFLDMPGSNAQKKYYVLSPVNASGSRSFLPVDNTKVVIREVINEEEALKLIDEIPEIEEILDCNDKQREEKYKELARTCDCRGWICIIKTIFNRKQERIAQGKKITATDDRYFKLAEENLYSELGFALSKEKDEMEEFIANRLNSAI